MKIQTTNKNVWGRTIILPEVGETAIPENGIIEVSDGLGKMLTKMSGNWNQVDNDSNKTSKTDETKKIVKKVAKEVEVDEEDSLKLKEILKTMTIADMTAVAKKCSLPADEIEKYSKNKMLLTNYLVRKLDKKTVKILISK